MRDGRLIDTDRISQGLLAKALALSQVGDTPVNRPLEPTTHTGLSLHARTVDQRSTFVNTELVTDLPGAGQRLEYMGDERHKKSRPTGRDSEIVTPAFRKRARNIMRANKVVNRAHRRRPGDPEYLIDNDVQLAIKVIGKADGKTQIANILGPVKPTTLTPERERELIDHTTFLPAIRRALKMSDPILVCVEPDRALIVEWIAGLDDDNFSVFLIEYERQQAKR